MLMKRVSDFPGIATVDVCIGLMLAFAVLLKLSVMAAQVEQKPEINDHALYKVIVEWAGDSKDDVDTYLADPIGHLVYFRRLQDGLMSLERDDTGSQSNRVVLADGSTVDSAFNQEVVDIRGIVPGEYIVNLHMYRKDSDKPTPANVKLVKGGVTAHETTVILEANGDEKTAFRFTLTADGNVVDVNTMPKELVYAQPNKPN